MRDWRRTNSCVRAKQLMLVITVFVVLGSAMQLAAQVGTGSIVGQVQDPSGRVVVGAHVKAVNVGTNEATNATTNKDGYYSLRLLQPGAYYLTIQASGFQRYIQKNITIHVATTVSVDATLSLGEVTQSVTVTTAPPLLKTQSSQLGTVINTRSILNLPLDGRNAYGFASLVPGVIAPTGFSQTAFDEYNDQFISIDGSRPNENTFLLDGGINSEPAFTGPGYFPSVDMVKEYKVQTSNFNAEYSNTGGGLINVVTKGGTNKLHGSAWEFFRNTDLVGNDFFSNRAGLPRAQFRFNQFGVTLGGPIVHNKTFFFFNYEGLRWIQAGSAVGTLPTAAQRAGDFSNTVNGQGQLIKIYNPFTTAPDPNNPGQYIRDQYPGNKIPSQDINPVAKELLSYLPLPNQPGAGPNHVNNYVSNFSSPINENNFSLRIDQVLPGNQHLFARYSINGTVQDRPNLYGASNPDYIISNPKPMPAGT